MMILNEKEKKRENGEDLFFYLKLFPSFFFSLMKEKVLK